MKPDEERRVRLLLDAVHAVVLVMLVAIRPLMFGGDPLATDGRLWFGAVIVGWFACLADALIDPGYRWRWSWGGVLGSVALLIALPATVNAPDPASAWGWWASWLWVLATAGYVLQIAAGRERFIIALLCGSLMIQGLLAIGQRAFVFAEVAAQFEARQLDELDGVAGWRLRQRLDHGGVYGTMTLANFLATWCGGLLVLLVGLLWRLRQDRRGQIASAGSETQGDKLTAILLVGLACLALVVLWLSGAKGVLLALLLATALVALTRGRGWSRWGPPIATLLVVVAVLAIPALWAKAEPSVTVRLGYWRAAWGLITQAPLLGHGLESFIYLSPTTFAPEAEFSRRVHNIFLGSSVAAGLIVGSLVLALFVNWLRPLFRSPTVAQAPEAQGEEQEAVVPGWAPWSLILLLPYCAAFGTLVSDNLQFWPGGQDLLGQMAWAAGLATVAALVTVLCRRVPRLPDTALSLALVTYVIACGLDFHLHEIGVLATFVILACLREARTETRTLPPLLSRFLIAGVACGLTIGGVMALQRSMQLDKADRIITHGRGFWQALRANDRHGAWQHLHDLSLAADLPLPSEQEAVNPAIAVPQMQEAVRRADAWIMVWPASPARLLPLAMVQAPGPDRRSLLEQAVAQLPERASNWAALARAHARDERWAATIDAMREARARSPWQLAYALQLAHALQRQAALEPAERAQALESEARELQTWVANHYDHVHFLYRRGVPKPGAQSDASP